MPRAWDQQREASHQLSATFGGVEAFTMSQIKFLEDENWRIKRMFADLGMQADLLNEALGKSDPASSRP